MKFPINSKDREYKVLSLLFTFKYSFETKKLFRCFQTFIEKVSIIFLYEKFDMR